eukprot:SAG31_NODE_6413_length_2029_cov_1.188083_2_plen_106_part_01
MLLEKLADGLQEIKDADQLDEWLAEVGSWVFHFEHQKKFVAKLKDKFIKRGDGGFLALKRCLRKGKFMMHLCVIDQELRGEEKISEHKKMLEELVREEIVNKKKAI